MWKYYLFAAVFLVTGTVGAQVSTKPAEPNPSEVKPSDSKPDYSKEAFIDEQDYTKVVAENDGTSTRVASARVRIQSDAGVQRFGVLTFSYQNATESIAIDYVRVQKPDGTTIVTPPESIQDMPSEITRQAPFYSDLQEKHVAVKGLGVGDVLEYQVRWQTTKPLAAGQFWFAFNVPRDSIALHWEFQVSLPRDRAVKWKSPGIKPEITEDGGRRLFDWTGSQMEHPSPEQEKKDQEEKVYQAARGKLAPPDIQISTFQTWEEIGAWYNTLQQERVKPTAEIQAKAAELTKNAADENAKLHAIYNYVSTQFRYIGVAFGIGRYQPHAAAEVLANRYGDCKDKHTLLASLLEAAGIKAYPALISATRDLDPDVPSPAQFDHVITAVPQGSGFTWLDTTAEVAPFGYLLSPLWDKQALVIPADKSAVLLATPAQPATKALETFQIDAKLKDDGTLEGNIERSFSGDDTEVLLRAAFRRVPMTQWKELAQRISYGSGFSGDVSDVTVSPPEKTDEPFHFSYKYTRKDFPDWSERRISSPLPPMAAPAPEDIPTHPILLGATGELRYRSRVEVPGGYVPQLPTKIDLNETFAGYHGAYTIKDGTIETERRLLLKTREVSVSDYEAYKKFSKAVADDHEVYVGLTQRHVTPASFQDAIWTLPSSGNAEANRGYDEARNRYDSGDTEGEIAALRRAVEVDPKFTRAWLWMSEIYAYQLKPDLALEALRSAIANDPQQTLSYKGLGFALMRMHRYDDAIPVWQQLIAIAPDDSDGPANLGSSLFALKRYADAASALESAIKVGPDRASLYAQLGSVYIRADNEDKAIVAYKKALEMDATPNRFNNIGYELADANTQLPRALQYAERAVREEEGASAKVRLSELKQEDLGYTPSLAAYWDTLGWVHFRMGSLEKAATYLDAAWVLSQGAVEADHLGQVYEQENRKTDAIRMYRLAIAASHSLDEMNETKARLEHLGGTTSDRFGPNGVEELNRLRTIKLEGLKSDAGSAEFFVLLGPGPTVEDVKFISGSEKLKSADKYLRAAPFNAVFPDDGPTKLVRRGILSCSSISGCSFVLYTPDTVRSVN